MSHVGSSVRRACAGISAALAVATPLMVSAQSGAVPGSAVRAADRIDATVAVHPPFWLDCGAKVSSDFGVQAALSFSDTYRRNVSPATR